MSKGKFQSSGYVCHSLLQSTRGNYDQVSWAAGLLKRIDMIPVDSLIFHPPTLPTGGGGGPTEEPTRRSLECCRVLRCHVLVRGLCWLRLLQELTSHHDVIICQRPKSMGNCSFLCTAQREHIVLIVLVGCMGVSISTSRKEQDLVS